MSTEDGMTAYPRTRRSATRRASPPRLPVSQRLPARKSAGVGAQAHIRYCPTCGAKRKQGECPRGHNT